MRALSCLSKTVLVGIALLFATSGGTAAASGGMPEPASQLIHPAWKVEMEAGLAASDMGQLHIAALHFRRAVRIARDEDLPSEELAFSTYRLGETLRLQPDQATRGESAAVLLEEARGHFEAAYGSQHPVVIPVWVRLAAVHTQAGDPAASAAARAAADQIAVRSFPESHFLRERYGVARPAAMLHPLEMLGLASARSATPDQIVQGP